MNRDGQPINHTYRVRGDGGQGACIAVQSVLQEHGLCGYTEWTSPQWHFVYLTHLELNTVLGLLGNLVRHFSIRLENSNTQL
jgi:hypothetical protein